MKFSFAAALVDVLSGIAFVVIAFLGARVLLQRPSLVYTFFPVLTIAAMAVGYWRGRPDPFAIVVTALLTTAPLTAVALNFFSGRNKPFIVLPIVAFAGVCVGAALARAHAKPLTLAVIVLTLGIGGAFAGPRYVRFMVPSHDVDEAAVPFTIHLADGRTISSRDLLGSVVVLDFWATWCVPCQRELPIIQRAFARTKGDARVNWFAIDGVMTDLPGDPADTVQTANRYFQRYGYTIPLAWDGGATLEKSFRLSGFPTLLVIDRTGRVRMRHVGFVGSEDLEKVLGEKIASLY